MIALGFFENESVWRDEYGWNTVTDDGQQFVDDLSEIDIDSMPMMGLFADGSYPYYLDRLTLNADIVGNESDNSVYPDLLQMSQKAVNLLSAKYEKEGFFLLIEASNVDICGHENDIVCLLWEMEEFMMATEWVLNWAEQDGETLVVMLSDHETGGLTLGREGSYWSDDLVYYLDGKQARDGRVADAWYSFDFDYTIYPPVEVAAFASHYGAYIWNPHGIEGAKHTADWLVNAMHFDTPHKLQQGIQEFYLGDAHNITDLERSLTESIFNRSERAMNNAISMMMSARTLTGWTTHGHSGTDCALHAYGPMEDAFRGQWQNYEVGLLMAEIFGVTKEQQIETQHLQQLFVNQTLKLCDPHVRTPYIEWNDSITYPERNLLAGQQCVERWL